jgi:hypothetical protein
MTVNSIPVICDNCDYNFNPNLTLTATSAQLINNHLTISLNNPNSINYTLSDITVSFLNTPCNINFTTANINNFHCYFPITPAGNPQIPAGTGLPLIHVSSIGYVDLTNITNITVPLQVTWFGPQSAGPSGLI